MSSKRKREDIIRKNKKFPISHCSEGHCSYEPRRCFQWAMCRRFLELIRSNKNPTMCPYYKH